MGNAASPNFAEIFQVQIENSEAEKKFSHLPRARPVCQKRKFHYERVKHSPRTTLGITIPTRFSQWDFLLQWGLRCSIFMLSQQNQQHGAGIFKRTVEFMIKNIQRRTVQELFLSLWPPRYSKVKVKPTLPSLVKIDWSTAFAQYARKSLLKNRQVKYSASQHANVVRAPIFRGGLSFGRKQS